MMTPEAKISYTRGYLEALLGSPTVELSDAARKRIEHAILVLSDEYIMSEQPQQFVQ
jgi:hypothetical protein